MTTFHNRRTGFSLLALALVAGCAPDLGSQDCRRDFDCPAERPTCSVGRCVPRSGLEADASGPETDARTGAGGASGDALGQGGGGGLVDARSLSDLAAPQMDAHPSGDAALPVLDAHFADATRTDARPADAGSDDATSFDGRTTADGPPVPVDAVAPDDGPLMMPDLADLQVPDACAPTSEVCNHLDDDCDQRVDELGGPCYSGPLGTDGHGPCRTGVLACPGDFSEHVEPDCLGEVLPAVEICDLADNDCNQTVDDVMNDACACRMDEARDCYSGAVGTEGVGPCHGGSQQCAPGGEWGPCDDEVLPVGEACDGVDNDCDFRLDEGALQTFYSDGDGDGYGQAGASVQACTLPEGYARQPGDCADANPAINPGVEEACNLADEDCDLMTDEGVQSEFFLDADGDGFGEPEGLTVMGCAPPKDYVENTLDCHPDDGLAFPGAGERCNGLDDSCNRQVDEGPLVDCQPVHATSACRDGACHIVRCDPGYVDDDLDAESGCERGCDPSQNGQVLGVVATSFPGGGAIAATDDRWAAVTVEEGNNVFTMTLVFRRNASAERIVLLDGDSTVGTPAIARAPTGWVITARETGAGVAVLHVWYIGDAGPVFTFALPGADPHADPAVAVIPAADPGDARALLAWIGRSGGANQEALFFATGRAADPVSMSAPVEAFLALVPSNVRPGLVIASGQPVAAIVGIRNAAQSIATVKLGGGQPFLQEYLDLPSAAESVSVAARGDDLLFTTVFRNGERSLAIPGLVDANGPRFIDDRVSLGAPPGGIAEDALAIASTGGFLASETVLTLINSVDTQMNVISSGPGGPSLVGVLDPTAGPTRKLSVGQAPNRLMGLWIEDLLAIPRYMYGELNCR